LVVGRFQPLHLGHVGMIEYAASQSNYLIIGLGSCNKCDLLENPFSAQEREQMIKESIDVPIPYEIRRIPDFGDPPKWIAWIRENISFDVFVTNSLNERRIFEEAGFKVMDSPFFDRDEYTASQVRKRIIEDGDWAALLPTGAVKVMSQIDGKGRIKRLVSQSQ